MPLTTVYASKDQAPGGYLSIFLVTFTFADGSVLRLSTNPLSVLEGGADYGVQYGGNDYKARLSEQELARVQARSALGITLIPSFNFNIADPDSSIYIGYENAAGRGFKGATVTVDLVLYDVINKAFSTDSVRKYYGICELPRRHRRGMSIQSSSLKNPQRQSLPSIHVQPRCWKLYPTTPAQGQDGADNRSSIYWDCGYSPSGTGGNARGNLIGGLHASTCNRTRSDCIARGMFDKDSANRISRRFGGFEWNGPTGFKGKSFLEGKTVIGYNFTNEARFNDLVALVYGTGWVDLATLQPLGEPNSTRFEAIVCYGEIGNTGISKLVVNDIEVPYLNPSDTLFSWYYPNSTGSPGDRTGGFNTGAIYDGKGDPYGSIAVICAILPTALAQSTSLPHARALVYGPKIPVPNSNDTSNAGVAAWPRQFTTNPVWILLDLLTWSSYQYTEIDMASWRAAAAFCDTAISYVDQNGNTSSHARFKASLILRQSRSAADIIDGILNSFNGLLVPNNDGNLLQLFNQNTLADQQPAPITGSNYLTAVASVHADGSAGTGYVAYKFDESNILADTLVTVPQTSSEAGNKMSVTFQDEDNQYVQDSLQQIDDQAVARSGNQDLPSSYPIDGITNFDQAKRIINTRQAQLFRGNPRGDAGGTIRYQFETSIGALHLRNGHIVMLSWQQDQVSNQLFRVDEIQYFANGEKSSLVVSWHSDGWYQDSYGQTSDPFYSDPRKDIPLRPPYPWKPFGEVNIGDSMYPAAFSSFAVVPSYEQQADGTALTKLGIFGRSPANSLGKADPPNVPLQGLTSSAGGTFPSGNYLVGFASCDSDGHWSALSKLVSVAIPGGTNTNTITVNGISWPSNAVDGAAFVGPNELMLASNGLIGSTSGSVTLLDPEFNIGPPDVKFDHFHVRVKRVIHGGVVGAALSSVGTATAQIAGFGTSAVDDFKNRVLSLYGLGASGIAVPILNVTITGSSSDGSGNLNLTLSATLGGAVPGDVVVIRPLASSITSNTIGDPRFVNSLYPGGIANDETNLVIRIIAGTGAGQERRITSNTTTVYTIDGTWDIMPDATSIFIVVEQPWQYSKVSDTWHVTTPLPLNPQKIADAYIDNPIGGTYLVQVLTEDVNDSGGPDSYAPIREVYVFGIGLNIQTVTTSGTLSSTTQVVKGDATAGAVTRVLPPPANMKGRRLTLKKTDSSAHPVTFTTPSGTIQ